ncbi:MAG: hypothetical protein K8T90_22015 [Planctomycetes bacterium]|nr:hypothetical protein [Planctomycetota bacterium]
MTRRVCRVVFVAAAICGAFAASPSVSRAGDPPAAAAPAALTEHFELTSTGPADESQEFSRVLEAAWPQLVAYFGAAPKLAKGERMRVRFFETQAEMSAAIVAAGGVSPGGAGGYYCPVAKTSYAWRQPSRWYTRTLLLHEVIHQFHLRGVAAGAKAMPVAWWTEGIAEHLSHHTWDGTTLRIGVVPPVSLEDRPAAAYAAALAPEFEIESILMDAPLDRPLAMHLVRYLATGDAGRSLPKAKELATAADRGEPVTAKMLRRATGPTEGMLGRFRGWLRSAQQSLVVAFNEWDSRGADAVRGFAGVVGICRTREPMASVEATVSLAVPSPTWRAGVLLEWTGAGDYVIGEIENGTRVRVDRLVAGAWTTIFEGPLPEGAGGSPWLVRAERDGGNVVMRVGTAEVFRFESRPGPLGFCIDHCEADFAGIRMKVAPRTR